ncbi:MAG: hypothetical protein ACJAYX_000744 [Planctomycetota bacterium]|jgi:hypothetical protein
MDIAIAKIQIACQQRLSQAKSGNTVLNYLDLPLAEHPALCNTSATPSVFRTRFATCA